MVRCEMVADYVKLSWPWEVDGLNVVIILVALDVSLQDAHVEIDNGCRYCCLEIELGREAGTRRWVKPFKRGGKASEQTFAIRVVEGFQGRGDVEDIPEESVVDQESEGC
jgi:hypothetical protein